MDAKLFLDAELDVESAVNTASAIRSAPLQSTARAFVTNTLTTANLFFLPAHFVASSSSRERRLAFLAQALVSTKNVGMWSKSEKARQDVETEIGRLEAQYMEHSKTTKEAIRHAESHLQSLAQHQPVQSGLQALVNAVVTYWWTCFECLAKDLWVAALNAHPLTLGQPAFSSIAPDADHIGLSRKAVPIGLLARHGFDISECVGTILGEKFDFSGVTGIRVAYRGAFGPDCPLLDAPLGDKHLFRLEATRHLIVHRGGVTDQEYRDRVHTDAPVGELLVLSPDSFQSLVNTAITSGSSLLRYVDEWITAHSKSL